MEEHIELVSTENGLPRCAHCEVHALRAVRRKGDDLIPLCILCDSTHIHVRCISKLETSVHGYLRCANGQCHRLFSEHYNHNDINMKQLIRQRVFYRLTPVLWLLGSVASAMFLFLFGMCPDRAVSNACWVVTWCVQGAAALFFTTAFFGKVHTAAIYLKLTGSKERAVQRLTMELVLAGVAGVFGVLVPVLTLQTLYTENVGLACWVFAFHLLLLPTMLWKLAYYNVRMKREIRAMEVTLDAVSILDLRQSRAAVSHQLMGLK